MINEMIGANLSLKHCKHGLVLYRNNDMYMGKSIDAYGEFSEKEIAFFRTVIKPTMTVIDVGSNIGMLTLEMSKLADVVIAIEAERLLYQMTCANVSINNRRNVIALHAAAGEHEGTTRIPNIDFTVDGNFGCLSAQGHEAGDVVRLMKIDSMQLPSCGFIKVDVEGMEVDVIRGAQETIKRCRPILYVENDRRDNSRDLIALIMSLGYTPYWHFPQLFNPNNFAGNKENVFPGVASLNMACFPDGRDFNDGYRITSPEDWWENLKVVNGKIL